MGKYFNPELPNKFELNGSNYIDWKQCVHSLLLIWGYYNMVINDESPEKAAEQLKLDPDRRDIAYAIISLKCNIKVASQLNKNVT
ncbi:hypothetical protein O181_101710 [Austropuccinia psidii MF-1]|uniref:DUF4219 domain-containing protein n=1 Tax=Austropuccinia psidii MF-1 TaxID=1389203 RepID=A0A9Q3PI21_9BASI|nr:hypothetical protein [Austropuccinia psidii MF-1]